MHTLDSYNPEHPEFSLISGCPYKTVQPFEKSLQFALLTNYQCLAWIKV